MFHFLTFYFTLEYKQPTNNVTVSDEQQRDSAIHIHASIFLKLPSQPGCHITLSRVPCSIQ